MAKKRRSKRPKAKGQANPAGPKAVERAGSDDAGSELDELDDPAHGDAKHEDARADDKRERPAAKRDDAKADAKRDDAKPVTKHGHAKRSDRKQAAGNQSSSKPARAKRRANHAETRATKPSKLAAARGDDVTAPAFWFGFEVSWTKLAIARVALFAVLAVDALLQIRHAPRYGAGDFNVGHFAIFDSFGPGRIGYGVGQLIVAYLFTLVALGVATRVALPIATAIYAWLYFGSQLDSYQHHYLVTLVLGISCFVPWRRPDHPEAPVRTWAVRLLLVQLAVMYFWAAISKLDGAWLDGTALETQLAGPIRSLVSGTVGFEAAAVMVIVVELALALIVWIKRAAIVAAPLGLLFHIGIVLTGLEIGLFSYVMVAIYALVVPDPVWATLAAPFADLGAKLRAVTDRPGVAAIAVAIALATGVALAVRLPHAMTMAIGVAAVPLALAIHGVTRGGGPVAAAGIAHAVAIAMWLVVDRATPVAEDYYRFWGGSQRRLGDTATAEIAYRRLVEIAPHREVGHFHLGRILLATNRADEGLEELRAAQRADPHHARAFTEEARWLARAGRRAEALAKAKDAVAADPSSADAKSLLDSLSRSQPPPPPPKAEPE